MRTLKYPTTPVVLAVALLALAVGTSRAAEPTRLAARDEALLDDVQQRAVRYFIEQSDPVTGLTRDRAPANRASRDRIQRAAT